MKLLVGNWKMHGRYQEIKAFLSQACAFAVPQKVQPILSLPFVYLLGLSLPKGYALAGQDCSDQALDGPFTGQISASMLKDVGCQYVLVGHPERQALSTQKQDQQRALCAINQGLIPIICIADLAEIQEKVPHPSSLTNQPFVIAYEPAVGTDVIPDYVQAEALKLKNFKAEYPCLSHILYGGGINEQTLPNLDPFFDGFLVGRASRDIAQWHRLIELLS